MRKSIRLVIALALVAAGCSKQDAANPAPTPTPVPAAAPAPPPKPPAKTEKGYVLGKVGTLFLSFPEGWKDSVRRTVQRDKVFDAVQFDPPTGSNFAMLVEIVNLGEAEVLKADSRGALLLAGRGELVNSVETNLTILDLKGGNVTASYFRVTDWRWTNAAPPAGEFKFLTQGYAKLPPLMLTFRLVSNDPDLEPAALEVIKSARFAKP